MGWGPASQEGRGPAQGAGARSRGAWGVDLVVATLWGIFLYASIINRGRPPFPVGYGIVAVNTLLVLLFLTRRASARMSRHPGDWGLGMAGIVLPLLFRGGPAQGSVEVTISVAGQTLAVIALLWGLLSLGKSFGVVAAVRSLREGGAYRVVRHPIYAAELLFFASYLLANQTPRNAALWVSFLGVQILRARREERLLADDSAYGDYARRVPFRFIPGIL